MGEVKLKRGVLQVLGRNRTTKGFGCHCSGPAYGTDYCLCELAQLQAEQQDYEEDDYEDRKK